MDRGRFLTLEGGEGAGKSTQVTALTAYLNDKGIKTIATREVGGCSSAESIRDLWLGKAHDFWDPLTEVCLIMAARREHLCKTIFPALADGVWVVSDRYVDSTRAYQGIGQGLGVEKIDAFYREIAGNFWPDLTLFLDVPVENGLARVASRNAQTDRFEQQDRSFHETLRQAFLGFAQEEPDRWVIINAAQDRHEVQRDIEKVAGQLIIQTAG